MGRFIVELYGNELYMAHADLAFVGLYLQRVHQHRKAAAKRVWIQRIQGNSGVQVHTFTKMIWVTERTSDKKEQLYFTPEITIERWWTTPYKETLTSGLDSIMRKGPTVGSIVMAKTPMQTFLDSIHIAKEKMVGYDLTDNNT